MQLVERIADRILLMNKGREVLSGTLGDIRRLSDAGTKLAINLDGTVDLSKLSEHKNEKVTINPGSRTLGVYEVL